MNQIDVNVSPYLQQPLRSFQQVLEERARRERQLPAAGKPPTPPPANTAAETPAASAPKVDQTV